MAIHAENIDIIFIQVNDVFFIEKKVEVVKIFYCLYCSIKMCI